jgi:hypothetical protein
VLCLTHTQGKAGGFFNQKTGSGKYIFDIRSISNIMFKEEKEGKRRTPSHNRSSRSIVIMVIQPVNHSIFLREERREIRSFMSPFYEVYIRNVQRHK